jgi:N-methylhydantoinase A
LYNAENELRKHGMQRPLMVFRNDGNSSRVAKTVAMKTYSSGPRGGMEGTRIYAKAYGAKRVISFDVGGTTTDIGVASADDIDEMEFGRVEGVETAFPLCNILSAGIGGSSVLGYVNGQYKVGPESVGAAPGPACFARGGDLPTITDVYLLSGYFDPATYFSGKLHIDAGLAEKAIMKHVAEPSDVPLAKTLLGLDLAYHEKMAADITGHAKVDADTLLMAFGGAGPMSACKVAELAGFNKVIVPHAASVFCAYGIGFSDVRYRYEDAAGSEPQQVLNDLLARARRDMFAEGFDVNDCELSCKLVWDDGQRVINLSGSAVDWSDVGTDEMLVVDIVRRLESFPVRQSEQVASHAAQTDQTRNCLQSDGQWKKVPLYALDTLQPGDQGVGPAVLEDAYVTVRVLSGWKFEMTGNLDLLLTRSASK